MNLSDYENDPYAPRAKASQEVARAHRLRETTDDERRTTDDERPTVAALPLSRQHMLLAAIGIASVVGVLALAVSQLSGARPLQITPTSAPAFVAAPTASPAPTSAPTATAPRTISAYAAPDGVLLGQIEVDRAITPVAHYGSSWIQADVEGSGLVWIRAADVPGLALTGPDLAPAPQTGRGLTVQDEAPPEATPDIAAPPEPTVAWPTSAPAAIPDFAQPDIKATCKFTGCLGEKAVDLARAQACHALRWQYGDVTDEDTNVPEADMRQIRACVWEGLYR